MFVKKARPNKFSFILSRLAAPSSPFEDDSDDVDEEPLVRHRPRRVASESLAPPDADRSRSGSPEADIPADGGNRFPSEVSVIKSVLFLTPETRLAYLYYYTIKDPRVASTCHY